MSKKDPPNQEAFDKLLLWLDPDRKKAGEKYEKIRFRLIRIFSARGCLEDDDLADESINIVASRIDWLLENFVGEPIAYFIGVANKVYLDYRKRKPQVDIIRPDPPHPDVERKCTCLEKCMETLNEEEREWVKRYDQGDPETRIEDRKKLAEDLKISRNALRIRMFHIHSRLETCIEDCLEQLPVD